MDYIFGIQPMTFGHPGWFFLAELNVLIKFTIENSRSFAEPQSFSMVAGKSKQHKNHVMDLGGIGLLRLGLVFGANAAGKTNFAKSITEAKWIITAGGLSATHYHRPFKLDEDFASKPTRYEFVFMANGQAYEYAFSFNDKAIVFEQLTILVDEEGEADEIFFTRNHQDFDLVGTGALQKSEMEFVEFLSRATPQDKLFLTELKERNAFLESPDKLEAARQTYDWFDKTLITRGPKSARYALPKMLGDKAYSTRASQLIAGVDFGVLSLEAKQSEAAFERASSIADFYSQMESNPFVASNFMSDGSYYEKKDDKVVVHQIQTIRNSRQGNHVPFNFDEESSGTQRYISLIPDLLECEESEKVLIVDELDNNLHPLFTRSIVDQFLKHRPRSQMIATTHESILLDSELVRRDEIWLVEKRDGTSSLLSVEEFRVRPDLHFEKAYLFGRFGGVPLINDISWVYEDVETERQI